MAGVALPPANLQLILSPGFKLRAISHLPRIRQTFPGSSSRASSFWARSAGTRHCVHPSSGPAHWRYAIRERVLFSTSGVRGIEPRDTDKEPSSAGKTKQEASTKSNLPPKARLSPSALTSTLKAKLAPLRHENIYTLPNILTFSRLIATPLIGYFIIHNHHLYAFSLFMYAGISDLLDGWIARKWKLQTVVGSVVDPMADKALMTTLVGCLAVNGSLSVPLATLILGRDVSLAIAAIYYRYASLPAPKTLARYWDFSLPSAEVHPTTISKFNTFLQLGLIGTMMCVGLLHDPSAINSVAGGYLTGVQEILGGPERVGSLVTSMQVVVATTTIWSGLSYAWLKSAVTILGHDEALKRKQGFRGRMIVGGCFGAVIIAAVGLAWRDWLKGEEEAMEESHD
ncbi:hypothetical protein CC78DRAFT_621647 [Lojkania enalia]|uniref:Uncharacterized protein n=1 Tax=Lojkania enalia TaxID=147567 RepID=A0A9P4N4U2_9PLEO|nr:hypothetical protein CC78DRAFT_621647 [Didymosphaeria enalia]